MFPRDVCVVSVSSPVTLRYLWIIRLQIQGQGLSWKPRSAVVKYTLVVTMCFSVCCRLYCKLNLKSLLHTKRPVRHLPCIVYWEINAGGGFVTPWIRSCDVWEVFLTQLLLPGGSAVRVRTWCQTVKTIFFSEMLGLSHGFYH